MVHCAEGNGAVADYHVHRTAREWRNRSFRVQPQLSYLNALTFFLLFFHLLRTDVRGGGVDVDACILSVLMCAAVPRIALSSIWPSLASPPECCCFWRPNLGWRHSRRHCNCAVANVSDCCKDDKECNDLVSSVYALSPLPFFLSSSLPLCLLQHRLIDVRFTICVRRISPPSRTMQPQTHSPRRRRRPRT